MNEPARRQGIIFRTWRWDDPPRLPPGCKLLGVSPHVDFRRNLLAYKVGHADLPAAEAGRLLPRVEPLWQGDTFLGWKQLAWEDPV